MRMRAFWMLAVALLLAGGSVFLARNWLENQVQPVIVQENQAPEIPLTKVVVAGTSLQFGNVLRREHMRLVDWPAATVPPGAFESYDQLLSGEEQRVVLRPIEPNEPILKSKVSGFGGRAILSSMLAPNMRAMTIRINDVTGVAGFVLPGDHVDILLTRDRSGFPVTDIFMQNIKVLGIDQDANQSRQKPGVVRAVTFEVTPTQAQKLVLSQKVGTLSLALRHTTNVDAVKPMTIGVRDLRIGEANVPEQPEPTSLVLEENEAPQIAAVPRKIEPTKPVSGKSNGIVTKKVSSPKLPSVRIVRAMTPTSYEVPREKGGSAGGAAGAPGTESPMNLLPSSKGGMDQGGAKPDGEPLKLNSNSSAAIPLGN